MVDDAPTFELDTTDAARLTIRFSGDWVAGNALPTPAELIARAEAAGQAQLALDGQGLGRWDTLFVALIYRVAGAARRADMALDTSALPAGVRQLVQLATAVPERHDTRKDKTKAGWLAALGEASIRFYAELHNMLRFTGEIVLSLGRWLRGKARFRGVDLTAALYHSGPGALPIVGLISVLVGMILAYVGAVQLQQFGAEIYIADLVALGMVREMGAMMTAVIMAGRSGAAFASQLGSMEVNQETDALRTLGISPIDYLVLPRMFALILMLPLLCLYADFLGIFGGAMVAALTLDISFREFYVEAATMVDMVDVWAGVIKACVFGVLVAIAGCMRGIQCGRTASAVGEATTSAVVTGIVAIVVADATLTIIYDLTGF